MKKIALIIIILILAIVAIFILIASKSENTPSGVNTTMVITGESGEVINKRAVRLVNTQAVKSQFYDARSVDECINEQACLLAAFSKFTIIYKECADCIVHKWHRPIEIKIIGSEEDVHIKAVKGFVETVQKNISIPISFSDEPNFLIVFSDNIDRDVYGKYREYLSSFYNWDQFIGEYEKSKLMSQLDINDHRRLFKATPFYSDDQGFEKYAVFIDVKDSRWKRNLNRRLFTGLGFISNSYSMTGVSGYYSNEIGKLKQRLIQILYNSKIKSGQTIAEITEGFDEIVKD